MATTEHLSIHYTILDRSVTIGFNKVVFTQFFNLLTGYINQNKLNANKIYNCDEIDIIINSKL